MSLDVYLTSREVRHRLSESGIFIRENGSMREVTRDEWNARFPDREPIVIATTTEVDETEVYRRNVTHNLGRMAHEAGIYKALWRPEEVGITKARQLVAPLTEGLALLRAEPERFAAFNPENGWGDYDGLVDFVAEYLIACVENPDAEVSVSR